MATPAWYWSPARRMLQGQLQAYKQHVSTALSPLFEEDWSVLDVGCDDGTTATLIQARRPSLRFEGVDIQSLRDCKIPRHLYNGVDLPFETDSFDCVMAVDMLHHTRHIERLVGEMARVSRECVIIKDHLTTGAISWLLVSAGDAITNLPFGIPCAYNFPSLPRWLKYFERAGLHLQSFTDELTLPSGCIRRYNPVFSLRKAAVSISEGEPHAVSTLLEDEIGLSPIDTPVVAHFDAAIAAAKPIPR